MQKSLVQWGQTYHQFGQILVLDDLEISSLFKLDFTAILYYRYMDDILTCAPLNQVDNLHRVCNDYDEDMEFTFEFECDGKIPFLDIRDGNRLITIWYRKPTASNTYLNFASDNPFLRKKLSFIYL